MQKLALILSLAALSSAQPKQSPDENLARQLAAAHDAEKDHDYRTASRDYEEILKQQPRLALIRQSLAITYHLQNRFPEAIFEFERALQLDATLWGSCLFLGMDYYKTNQFSRAISPLEKSISLNAARAEPEARFWLGVTYTALNRPADAVQQFRQDLALRPGNIDVLYYLTKAYDQAAANAFQKLGNIEPRAAAVSLLQAERFLDENRRDLASVQYRGALWLRPDFAGWIPQLAPTADGRPMADLAISATDARADLELALLLAAAGDRSQSETLLQRLADQKPADAQANKIIAAAAAHRTAAADHLQNGKDILQGLELIRQGNFRAAEQPVARAAAKNPSRYLEILLMRAYIEAGDCEQVEDRLHKRLLAEPASVDALLLSGRCYKQQENSTLQRMIQIDPDSYGVHELLGKQHEEKTEYELAIKEYEAALANKPDLAGIHYAIGNVYRKMSRFDEAEKWLTEELAENPYHGMAHYRLGSIYTEQEKPDAAIPHLLEALQSHPQLMDAELDLGRAYMAKGRYPDAIAALKRVSVAEPENDRVHYLLSQAYSKEGRRADAQLEITAYQRLTRERLQRTQQDVKDLSNSLDK